MNSVQAVKRLRFEGEVAVEAILVATQRKQHAQAIKPFLSNFIASPITSSNFFQSIHVLFCHGLDATCVVH